MATEASDVEALEVIDAEEPSIEPEEMVDEVLAEPTGMSIEPAGQEPVKQTSNTNSLLQKVRTNLSARPGGAGTTGTGGKPYSSFSESMKVFIVVLSAIAGTFSPFSTFIYVPAIPTLATAFNVTEEKINLTVTIYLVFQGLTPALWGSAADSFGRRPIYLITLVIYVMSCIGSALCPTNAYWLLMLMRIMQATGGAAVIAIGTGVVSDIAMPHERGKYLGIFSASSNFGPSIGPLLGGVFAYTLGWRSIFWFLVIACSLVLIPMTVAFPETLRSLVGDGSIPPPLLNCTPQALFKRKKELKRMQEKGEEFHDLTMHRVKFRPWASFALMAQPDLTLVFIWASLYYALWYCVLTIFSTLLQRQYHLNEIAIGCCYISSGVGSIFATVGTGRIMDILYRREVKRVGGDHRAFPETFRLERVRFAILPFQAGLLIAACISIGWALEAQANLAVPVILNFVIGLSTGFLTTVTIYGIDLFPSQGGAVTATFNVIRCLTGAISVAVIQELNNAMGSGWAMVLISGICLLGSPLLWVILKWGPGLRLKRIAKNKKREEKRRKKEKEALEALARAQEV